MTPKVDIGFSDTDRWFAGSTRRFTIPIVDADGNPKNLTGAPVADWRMTDISPAEGTPTEVLSKSLGSGVEITDEPGGEITVTAPASDTLSLEPRDYYYEARVVDAIGDAESVTYGYIRLSPTVFAG